MFLPQIVSPVVNPAIPSLATKKPGDAPAILAKFFSALVGLLLFGATIWAFIQLLIGAFNWISSSGDKAKLEMAQQKIIQAIVGLIIVFAAWAIFLFLLRFLGIIPSVPGGTIQFKLPSLF